MTETASTFDNPLKLNPESWRSARIWLWYTLIYGFMPLWLGVIASLGFSKQPIEWSDFLIHGEFLIYSASLVAGSTRLVAKDVSAGRPFPFRQYAALATNLVIIPSAAIFAMIKVASFNDPNSIKKSFVIGFSLPVLASSIVLAFLIFGG